MERIEQQRSRGLVDDIPSSLGADSARVQLKNELARSSAGEQQAKLRPPRPFGAAPRAVETPVQSDSGSDGVDTSRVKEAAASGLSGASSQLPHFDTIQKSFGRHDVSSVSAHVGGPAAKATSAMGATAYATGSSVAFRSSPDLHTAAHEAAHVIQQRAGVNLSDGVGRAGDSYERHADAVASAVVSGHSAQPLLDASPGGGTNVQRLTVQREGTGSTGASSSSSDGAAQTGGSATALPAVTYVDALGETHTVSVKVEGQNATVMHASGGPAPLKEATDSSHPWSIAAEIEALTKTYLQTGEGLETIKQKMVALQEAMAKARGDQLDQVEDRIGYEKELGAHAWAGDYGNFARAGTCVKQMCANAVKMIAEYYGRTIGPATSIDDTFKIMSNNADFKKAIESLGIPTNIGFAGAVGTGFEQLNAMFSGSDMTEQCVHLGNFGAKFLGEKVGEFVSPTDPGAVKLLEQIKANLGSSEYANFLERCATAEKNRKPGNVLLTEEHTSPEYIKAKEGSGDMDRKTPYVPVEALDERELAFLANMVGVDLTGCKNKDEIVAKLKGAGYKLSAKIEEAKYLGAERPPSGGSAGSITKEGAVYLEGIADNIVKPDHQWIQAANELQMPLKAGISGTTHRFMSLAKLLGCPGSDARLAMLGHLQRIEAHSFHEICVAALGFDNCAYTEGKYVPFSPIPEQQMRKVAKDVLKAGKFSNLGDKDLTIQADRMMGLTQGG